MLFVLRRIAQILLLCSLFLLSGCSSDHESKLIKSQDTRSGVVGKGKAQIRYESKVEYPRLSSNAIAAHSFNALIKARVAYMAEGFLKAYVDDPASNPGPSKVTTEVSYDAYHTQAVVSVVFYLLRYWQSTPYPNNLVNVVNYDLLKGRQIRLAALFKGQQYLQLLSKITREQFKKKDIPDYISRDITAPKQSNFNQWGIGSNGLTIYFSDAQLPHALGSPTVFIPLQQIVPELSNYGRDIFCTEQQHKAWCRA
jgi:hypothetical protein